MEGRPATEDWEILGYEEPSIKQEEFWFYSTMRDAGELIRTQGAEVFLDELDDRAKKLLLKEMKKRGN